MRIVKHISLEGIARVFGSCDSPIDPRGGDRFREAAMAAAAFPRCLGSQWAPSRWPKVSMPSGRLQRLAAVVVYWRGCPICGHKPAAPNFGINRVSPTPFGFELEGSAHTTIYTGNIRIRTDEGAVTNATTGAG